jgi:hypothetical protein
VLVTQPRFVVFTAGLEKLACMSLWPKGMLRWYARCCQTPIANTMRASTFPHVGLIHNCLESPSRSLETAFGPVRMRVNRLSAKGTPIVAPRVLTLEERETIYSAVG